MGKCKEDGCHSPFGSYKYGGYCYPHAKKNGFISAEKHQVKINRTKMTRQKHKAEKQFNENKMTKASMPEEASLKKIIKPIKIDTTDELTFFRAKELYHNIVGDRNFNLHNIVAEMKGEDNSSDIEAVKKRLFLKWFYSDTETRKPQSTRDVAFILKVTYRTVLNWQDSDWFEEKTKEQMKKVDILIAPYIQRIRNILALAGNQSAIFEFYKKVELNVGKENSIFEGIGDELLEEATKISEADESKERIVLSDEEEANMDTIIDNIDGIDT